jgi:cell wall-associated NlpC family hydrolase
MPPICGVEDHFWEYCSVLCRLKIKNRGNQASAGRQTAACIGKDISLNEARAGDIAFFGPDQEKITHTGIFLDDSRIIHASGKVRIDSINGEGIFSSERKQITHTLQMIKRVII